MVPAPKAGSKPGAPGEGREGREGEEQRKFAGKGQQARAGSQESPRDGGWTAGSPETSTARERAQPRTGPGACEGPRRRQARGGRSKSRRRGGARGGRPGGRPAPRLPRPGWAPRRRGRRERGQDAGRSEQLFFPGCSAAARGLGRWPPARETVFFFLFKASPLPPGGARGCRRVEAGGGPHPRCPPRQNPPPRGALSRGPSPGPARPAARFFWAGRGGRPGHPPAPLKRETEAEGRAAALPRSRGEGEARWGWNPGVSLFPASLAHVGVLPP